MIYIFENGKGVRISLESYQFRASRKKLSSIYSGASPIVAAILEDKPKDIIIVSYQNKAITIKSSLIPEKSTRTAGGVTLFTLKGKATVAYADEVEKSIYPEPQNYRKIKVPATGSSLYGVNHVNRNSNGCIKRNGTRIRICTRQRTKI